ncbi:MAG: FAD-dependent oxidoreductase [Spirochaetaceae bacterium]|nr:FAD-dependent oxidoreductase [Spirochaetaceae bacterium]
MRIVIVGGGWAGCAAALAAVKAGAKVTLLERTDMLLGTGLVGGIMRNNGRFTAAEECIALGAGELFEITDRNCRHKGIEFPGHKHVSLYDVASTPGAVHHFIDSLGVEIVFNARVDKADLANGRITRIAAGERVFEGDVFIDATGTAGPMNNCAKYGNGCAMCILRCPSFGGRLSLTGLAGIAEEDGKKTDGTVGAMSGSCKILKESLSPGIAEELDKKGVVIVPLPPELREDHLSIKACQQYATPEFKDNIVLLDTGHAKLMTPFFDLEQLRKVPGFQNARYEDPYAGSRGNSMRFFSMAPRDDALKVQGLENLFCGGEKAGLLVGHTEAIVTGVLAGHNAVRHASGKPLLVLPRELAIGEAIAWVREQMAAPGGMGKKYTFSGSVLFDRMKELDLYTIDIALVKKRVASCGMEGVFAAGI